MSRRSLVQLLLLHWLKILERQSFNLVKFNLPSSSSYSRAQSKPPIDQPRALSEFPYTDSWTAAPGPASSNNRTPMHEQ